MRRIEPSQIHHNDLCSTWLNISCTSYIHDVHALSTDVIQIPLYTQGEALRVGGNKKFQETCYGVMRILVLEFSGYSVMLNYSTLCVAVGVRIHIASSLIFAAAFRAVIIGSAIRIVLVSASTTLTYGIKRREDVVRMRSLDNNNLMFRPGVEDIINVFEASL
jgi:hypothetical protein